MSTTYACDRCRNEVDPVTGKRLTQEIYLISGVLHRPEVNFHLCDPCLALLDEFMEPLPLPEMAVRAELESKTPQNDQNPADLTADDQNDADFGA